MSEGFRARESETKPPEKAAAVAFSAYRVATPQGRTAPDPPQESAVQRFVFTSARTVVATGAVLLVAAIGSVAYTAPSADRAVTGTAADDPWTSVRGDDPWT